MKHVANRKQTEVHELFLNIFLPNKESVESIIYRNRHILEEQKDYRTLFQTAQTLHKTEREDKNLCGRCPFKGSPKTRQHTWKQFNELVQ